MNNIMVLYYKTRKIGGKAGLGGKSVFSVKYVGLERADIVQFKVLR